MTSLFYFTFPTKFDFLGRKIANKRREFQKVNNQLTKLC